MSKKILIADDEECVRFTFSSFLVDAGYIVETAESLSDCMKKLESADFDLLLLDIRFGKDNGIDAIQQIRELNPACQIIMITGDPRPETIIKARQYGVKDYLAKPVHKASLLYNVKKVFIPDAII